jgi:hypothetical protein
MTNDQNTLDELLADPLIQIVMASDGVQPEDIRMLLERALRPEEPSLPQPHMIAQACWMQRICA